MINTCQIIKAILLATVVVSGWFLAGAASESKSGSRTGDPYLAGFHPPDLIVGRAERNNASVSGETDSRETSSFGFPSDNSTPMLRQVVYTSSANGLGDRGGSSTFERSLVGESTSQDDLTTQAGLDTAFTKKVRPFIEAYCLDCHTGDDAEGEFDLDKFLEPGDVARDLESWSHVLARLERGDMPPSDSDQPKTPAKEWVLKWILGSIDTSKENAQPLGRIRRLNRVEYENTVRDLFRLSRNCFTNPDRITQTTDYFNPATKKMPRYALAVSYFYNSHRRHSDLAGVSTLPVDPPVDHGYSNDQAALSLSPLLMENYFDVATALVNAEEFSLISGIWESMFTCRENAATPAQIKQANEQIAIFLPRAFRRAVSMAERARYEKLFKTELDETKSYTQSMKTTVSAILVSPHFLFRREFQVTKNTEPGGMDQNFANASRLSYFLWSSMPDDILFQAAREKRLVKPSDLVRQVDRMMDDKRIKSLSTDFGMQWLKMKKVASVLPDGHKFPDYYRRLVPPPAISMMIEQLLLFETIMVENRSVVEFVTADFGYVNRQLMDWYQLDPKKALGYSPKLEEFEDFFRVKWRNLHQGGIMSGAMLISTSTTTRTSPVYRGAWVLDVLFNSPPPPAPAGIPPLQTAGTEKKDFINVREKLKEHRANAACATCHDLIDPMGFAFEKYDAVGRWRKTYETGDLIEPKGSYNGFDYDGVAMFKVAVTRDKTRFVRAFIEHTMKYALGRKLHYSDQPEIRQMTKKVLKNDARFRAVIKEVVLSEMFRQPLRPIGVTSQAKKLNSPSIR